MNILTSFYNILERILTIILILLLSLMVIFIFAQVFFRYILNNPLSWTEELSRHLMIWSAFVGSAVAYRNSGHMGVDLIYNILPEMLKKILVSLTHFGILTFSIFLSFKGFEISEKTMRQLSSALRIKMGYIYSAIPVGFVLIALFSLEHIIKIWLEKQKYSK